MAKLTLIEAVNAALKQEMELDPRVVVLGEDVGFEGGVFRATVGLQEKFGEARVVDTPLSEAGIVGCSIGMALYGLRPVAEIQFEGFILPAFDQLVSHAARIRTRSRGRFTCPIVVRSPYGGGVRALEHHSEAPETLYAHVAGLNVVIPSTPYDAKGLLSAAIQSEDPVLFFEPKRLYRAFKEEVPEERYTVPIGKAKIVRPGNDVTLVTYGGMVRVAQDAADQVAETADIEIIDLRTISPMDTATILQSVQKTGRCIVLHEAPRTLGIASEIIARINEKALLELKAPVQRVTGWDVPVPLPRLEDFYQPDVGRVIKAIEKVMQF